MTKTELKYMFLIIVIFIAACIETDIYLPAFTDMMSFFSASEEMIQNILTWNFVGICISGPFYGPLSDSIGRKKPLLFALGLFLLGSVITLFAQSFDHMLIGRALQGIGSGGCFTLGTAIIFDAFRSENVVLALNRINSIVPFIMAGAPILGGYLNQYYGFRSNFLAIALLVLLSFLAAVFYFDETLPEEKRKPLNFEKILNDFKLALTNIPFWILIIVLSLQFTSYITFLSITAVLFVIDFGVSKELFPLFQGSLLAVWLLASLTYKQAIAKWGTQNVKITGIILFALGSFGFGLTALIAPENPYLLTGITTLCAFGVNWAQGIYFPEGMDLLPNIKGTTASLLTSIRLFISAAVVGLTSHLYDHTIFPLAVVIVGNACIVIPLIIIYEKMYHVQRKELVGKDL